MAHNSDSHAVKARNPSGAGTTVRDLLSAVDAAGFDVIEALVAEDVHFRFGNAEPTTTRSELLAAAQSFRTGIDGLRHDLLDLWEIGDDVVGATMDVTYRRRDGRDLTLPCCN